jgi:hypothetical protein
MRSMAPRTAVLVASLAVVGVCLAGCGGITEVIGEPGGAAGSSAGTSGGRSGAVGGEGGAGGTGAGAMPGSGAVGGTGAGATGSICSLPLEMGSCKAYFPRFFHNPETGVCESFIYGGCGGNENNFETFEECEAACGSKPLDTCEDNDDCVLHAKGCCGACYAEGLSGFVAINVAYEDTFWRSKDCSMTNCSFPPECDTPWDEPSETNYFVATCQANRCVAIDIRTTEVTECEQPSDCWLRWGANCCSGCGDASMIALSNESLLSELVCPKEKPPCVPCREGAPQNYIPDCQAGRCVILPPT